MQATTVPSTTPIPGQYWQWRGHKIYYVRAGEKRPQRPPLLLVHGFGASTDHWRKNITGLCDDFEVFAIDLLGFGRSAKPKLQYGGDLWRDQLHDFISEVIGQKTVLAGNSLGGYACLCVAAQRPESAAGVVLLNSAGPFSETQTTPEPEALQSQIQPPKQSSPLQKIFGDSVKWIFQQPLAQFLLFQYVRQGWVIRQTLEKVYLDKSAITNQLVEEIARPAYDVGALDVFVSVFSSPQGEKVDVLLKQLTCPLLMLWGEADPWINARERSQKFRLYYPELTEYFLKAGHCPHDEVPNQVNPLLQEWVLSIAR
ncbi:Alpha/beta hydrolase fold protein [Trichormus variabilis ATCC 29413]|uniref:Alpha/beta hydrolase fold protein n=2 Tax=Anabaena variabilis TaxID=264691 RepID=Q3M8H5_TRIV2|nr:MULTISPECIES: alpha/beta fold hydrolase [Nostocaceae]ABA22711.1 Alpha/beta hydrolase fold protein [Trichormus variabilis ATCC 29413]MBC1215050.1 alpha/beta fold hydrolase [Trichormus variabilis ARAD]MBC1257905.1 alpha/beta fold hydrolase [Trichormus variabilis V5]MBC1270321.1 alpha/beta fold hydrolase [Trichormus variabilis FSR]MBC1303720.1 alpha/beta fold hydrolase [Trichormus variabilis N2B]